MTLRNCSLYGKRSRVEEIGGDQRNDEPVAARRCLAGKAVLGLVLDEVLWLRTLAKVDRFN